jgi:hypothetical protein
LGWGIAGDHRLRFASSESYDASREAMRGSSRVRSLLVLYSERYGNLSLHKVQPSILRLKELTAENKYPPSSNKEASQYPNTIRVGHEAALRKIRPKQSSGEGESDLIYQGIAERNFERNFQLADHVQIKGASLENGLLQVDLLRMVPEAMKPRAIPITTAKKAILDGKAAKIAA